MQGGTASELGGGMFSGQGRSENVQDIETKIERFGRYESGCVAGVFVRASKWARCRLVPSKRK